MENFKVFLIFLSIRLSSVLLVQTYFVPDEYYQSLEIAHKFAFNYGYATWEWLYGLRSSIYPLTFSGFYMILKCMNLDYAEILIYGPRVLQSLLSAYSDLCFYEWSGTKKWAIFTITTSWFWYYTGSRTLINTFESCLTTIALSNFPWVNKRKDNCNFLWLVAFVCYTRPTAATIWLPLCLYHLIMAQNRISIILTRYLPIGLTIFAFCAAVDSWFYGRIMVTPYEFIKFNTFENIGSYYGTQPWFWYLSIGFPAILGIQFIPFVIATLIVLKNRKLHLNELILLGTIVFTLTIYSLLPHKEFRFILPLLPLVFYISSRFLSVWSRKASRFTIWLVAIIILFGNLGPAFYLSFIHQRGTLDVMSTLREISYKNPNSTNLLFLMPCHSTPLYSHLHVNVTTKFLTCEPNLNQTNNYIDEADQFYRNPNVWLRQYYPPNGTLPTHIICFDILKPIISDILSKYKTTHEIFHTSFPTTKIGRYVLINQRIDIW